MKTLIILILGFTSVAMAQYAFPPHPVELKPILEVQGVDSNEALGADTKGVGDLNKDGYADVAVSAPGYHQTFIYFGGKTMSDTPSVVLKGGGQIVSGDFKGNGWTDLAIEDFNTNTVLVYYNGPNGLDTIPDLTLTSTPKGDYFGPIMTTGDFFGNGYTDLAVSTFYQNWPDKSLDYRGRIFIFAGGPGGLNSTPVDTLIGDTDWAMLGKDLAAGDIYDNGKDALVAFGFNESCSTLSCDYSYISVFSADSNRHMRRSLYIDSRHVPGGFGAADGNGSVACFDADGDGIADLLVSGIDIFKGGSTIDTLPTYFVPPPNGDTADFGPWPCPLCLYW